MQRTIVLTLLVVVATLPSARAEAQDRGIAADERRVQPKLMFGFSIGDLRTTPHEPHEFLFGGTFGAGVEYALSDQFQLEARAMLLDKSSVYTDVMVPRPQDFYDVTLSLRYVAVPVLVKFRPTRGGFYLFAGPELAFRTGGRQVFARYREGDTIKEVVDLDANPVLGHLNRSDVALAGGLGLQRNLGRLGLDLEVYASRGLRNVLRETGHEHFGFRADSVRTESIAFLSGIRF
jgi:hypothetical protein